MLLEGKLSFGEVLRVLRGDVLRMDRATFAARVGLSEAAIAKLEDDREANPTLKTLRQVFQPFGGRIGLVFPGLLGDRPREDTAEQRREILAALARTRRKKPAKEEPRTPKAADEPGAPREASRGLGANEA